MNTFTGPLRGGCSVGGGKLGGKVGVALLHFLLHCQSSSSVGNRAWKIHQATLCLSIFTLFFFFVPRFFSSRKWKIFMSYFVLFFPFFLRFFGCLWGQRLKLIMDERSRGAINITFNSQSSVDPANEACKWESRPNWVDKISWCRP